MHNKEKEFIKVIEDLAIAFEASGVNNENLKTTIDKLFDLKEFLKLKEALGNQSGSCMTCSFLKEEACTILSASITDKVNIELFPPGTKNRQPIQVPLMFRCRYYKP